MRTFHEKKLPEYMQVDWPSATNGTAIFIGANVFTDPYGNIMNEEIQEFKHLALQHGVVLTMRREFREKICNEGKDYEPVLSGFWFYCVRTTSQHITKVKREKNKRCFYDIIKIFKAEDKPLKISEIINGYGLVHSQRSIRETLNDMASSGLLIAKNVKTSGRPTTQYERTQEIVEYPLI